MTYQFYRPPFALKVRATYPGYADKRTETAIDDAVLELIPAIRVTAPQRCYGRKIHTVVGPEFAEMSTEEGANHLLRALAEGALEHSLHGCGDLVAALRMATNTCHEQGQRVVNRRGRWPKNRNECPSTTDQSQGLRLAHSPLAGVAHRRPRFSRWQ